MWKKPTTQHRKMAKNKNEKYCTRISYSADKQVYTLELKKKCTWCWWLLLLLLLPLLYFIPDYIPEPEEVVEEMPDSSPPPASKICVSFLNTEHCEHNPISGIENQISYLDSISTNAVSNQQGVFELCAFSNAKPKILSENAGYVALANSIDGSKTMYELSLLPQPIELPMQLKGEIGDLNFRIIWNTRVDVDFRITDPNGHEIDSHETGRNRFTQCPCGGKRDLDNTSGGVNSVENIFWAEPPHGKYKIEIQLHSGNEETPVNIVVSAGCKMLKFTKTLSRSNKEVFVGEIEYPWI